MSTIATLKRLAECYVPGGEVREAIEAAIKDVELLDKLGRILDSDLEFGTMAIGCQVGCGRTLRAAIDGLPDKEAIDRAKAVEL